MEEPLKSDGCVPDRHNLTCYRLSSSDLTSDHNPSLFPFISTSFNANFTIAQHHRGTGLHLTETKCMLGFFWTRPLALTALTGHLASTSQVHLLLISDNWPWRQNAAFGQCERLQLHICNSLYKLPVCLFLNKYKYKYIAKSLLKSAHAKPTRVFLTLHICDLNQSSTSMQQQKMILISF